MDVHHDEHTGRTSASPRQEFGSGVETTGLLKRFAGAESGATGIEYGMIAGLISVVVIGTITTLGTKLDTKCNTFASQLS